jgi:cytochrome P450 / NADPH-cytochrome P450 reductase
MASSDTFTPIPQPPSIPFFGNVRDVDFELPLRSFSLLAKTYGEIYQLSLGGTTIIFANSYQLNNEISDEKRFRKQIAPSLQQVRNLVKDGLFTAYHDEPNWAIARMFFYVIVILPEFCRSFTHAGLWHPKHQEHV